MTAAGRDWTEDEIQQAIDLYVRTPSGKIHSRNPEIIELADVLGRTSGSIALKMANIASLDETLDRKGMSRASNLDRKVWARFFESISAQASRLPAESSSLENAGMQENEQRALLGIPFGLNIPRITNTRQGQLFFRRIVLTSYDEKCAITGIAQPELLVAGHIRPWAKDNENRMNPRNGICLNRLHDKAFEEGLIAIDDGGRVLYSSKLKSDTRKKMEQLNDTGFFAQPVRFKPDPAFLAEHRTIRFQP